MNQFIYRDYKGNRISTAKRTPLTLINYYRFVLISCGDQFQLGTTKRFYRDISNAEFSPCTKIWHFLFMSYNDIITCSVAGRSRLGSWFFRHASVHVLCCSLPFSGFASGKVLAKRCLLQVLSWEIITKNLNQTSHSRVFFCSIP